LSTNLLIYLFIMMIIIINNIIIILRGQSQRGDFELVNADRVLTCQPGHPPRWQGAYMECS